MIVDFPDSAIEALADVLAERVAVRFSDRDGRESPWMTTEEAATYCRVPLGTFQKWAASGRIPSHGGRRRLFHRAEVDRALGYVPVNDGHFQQRRRRDAA